ncbi:MAG: DNA polymerase IV [Marinicaulis sp.]|nr:DNA polymerase IV [Marinicaulis sp.]
MLVYDAAGGFCRACLTALLADSQSCTRCDSRRITMHPELFSLAHAHLDCDAFYAAVEKRDNPDLADQPVLIGGGVRGVVSTCCYIARTYGVHSAMPMFKAKKACPDAVIIKPNMSKYAEVGRAIRQLMLELTPLVEPLSIDEAFMDLSGTERLHGAPPAVTLARLQSRIEIEHGVTVSIGLSHNKFLSKIASDLDKPQGFCVIGKEETIEFLGRLPVTKIWGVGKAMSARLERDGIRTIAQLQKYDESTLGKRYGEIGLRLARLSQGKDARRVKPQRDTKSISSETTFNEDHSDPQWLEDVLWELCEKISARMKASSFEGKIVTLKLKTGDFKTITRRRTLDEPTNLARLAFDAGKTMLAEAADGRAFRLLGIGFSGLTPASDSAAFDMFNQSRERIAAQEKAIDTIREKFGNDAIAAGRKYRSKS